MSPNDECALGCAAATGSFLSTRAAADPDERGWRSAMPKDTDSAEHAAWKLQVRGAGASRHYTGDGTRVKRRRLEGHVPRSSTVCCRRRVVEAGPAATAG
ncbi:hypothetical protein MRX96_021406 [Rhipicephalus microplus]